MIGEILHFLTGLIFFIGVILVYFLPTIITATRRPKFTPMMSVLNLFLGWTCISWPILLGLSLMPAKETP